VIEAAVEPDGGVEGALLINQKVRQVVFEIFGVFEEAK
jgi:hypothetical protein